MRGKSRRSTFHRPMMPSATTRMTTRKNEIPERRIRGTSASVTEGIPASAAAPARASTIAISQRMWVLRAREETNLQPDRGLFQNAQRKSSPTETSLGGVYGTRELYLVDEVTRRARERGSPGSR